MEKLKIYAVQLTTFSSDIYGEEHIDSYWSTKDKAEEYILKSGLIDTYSNDGQSVGIMELYLDKGDTE